MKAIAPMGLELGTETYLSAKPQVQATCDSILTLPNTLEKVHRYRLEED